MVIWEEFELRHGQVYEWFYNILNQKHPELDIPRQTFVRLAQIEPDYQGDRAHYRPIGQVA